MDFIYPSLQMHGYLRVEVTTRCYYLSDPKWSPAWRTLTESPWSPLTSKMLKKSKMYRLTEKESLRDKVLKKKGRTRLRMPPTSTHTHAQTHTHTLLSRLLKPSGQKEAAFKEIGFVGPAYKIPTQMFLGNQTPDFSEPTWQQFSLPGWF